MLIFVRLIILMEKSMDYDDNDDFDNNNRDDNNIHLFKLHLIKK